jgi:hypothetical protein
MSQSQEERILKLEKVAKESEETIKKLVEQISHHEGESTFKKKILDDLIALRITMTNEQKAADYQAAELILEKEKNKTLEKELKKKEYRINIMRRVLLTGSEK